MNAHHKTKARICKALGHPIRYCIVEGLLEAEHNVASMVSCTNVPQPTISQHLTILRAAGIIKANRQGNQMLYSVCSDQARAIIRGLA